MYMGFEYWGKPVPSFGESDSRVLIVGLAPGAHGANRTGRMFTGDKSSDFLFRTLYKFGFADKPVSVHRRDGINLTDVYITAAVRCVPPDNKPLRDELDNCRPHFLEELTLLEQPLVTVALGKIAFDAFLYTYSARGYVLPSPRPRFGHSVEYDMPDGMLLIGCYHPSQLNTQTGRLTRDMFDEVFRRVRQQLISLVAD